MSIVEHDSGCDKSSDEACSGEPGCSVTLGGDLARAFNAWRDASHALHEVTSKAREDIEAAQQRYRAALAEFTRLSVAPEG